MKNFGEGVKNFMIMKVRAIKLLLANWNWRYISTFGKEHLNAELVKEIKDAVDSLDKLVEGNPEIFSKQIMDIDLDDENIAKTIKEAFKIFVDKTLIAGVGAAKSLHLLYPEIFVMWDSTLWHDRQEPDSYLRFMKRIKEDIVKPLLQASGSEEKVWEDHFSMLDEETRDFYGRMKFKESLLKMVDEYLMWR